jgi:hypothetical protein
MSRVQSKFSRDSNVIAYDLVEIDHNCYTGNYPSHKVYEVLSPVLSELNIMAGDILPLRLLGVGEIPHEISIVAATFSLESCTALILRLFVPPRQLVVNTDDPRHRPLALGPNVRLVAAVPWNKPASPWFLPLS